MTTFTLVTEHNRPAAIICDQELHGHQFDILSALLPEHARSHLELAKRWGATFVLCTDDFAHEQLKRVPMFRPKGHRLNFECFDRP